jgi:hypothetical protein
VHVLGSYGLSRYPLTDINLRTVKTHLHRNGPSKQTWFMVEGRKKGEEGRRGYKRKDLLPYLSLPTTLG